MVRGVFPHASYLGPKQAVRDRDVGIADWRAAARQGRITDRDLGSIRADRQRSESRKENSENVEAHGGKSSGKRVRVRFWRETGHRPGPLHLSAVFLTVSTVSTRFDPTTTTTECRDASPSSPLCPCPCPRSRCRRRCSLPLLQGQLRLRMDRRRQPMQPVQRRHARTSRLLPPHRALRCAIATRTKCPKLHRKSSTHTVFPAIPRPSR